MLRFSTYEESFDELLENEGLKKKAAKSGVSLGTLKKVYNRGMAAWRTGHRPGTTPQQWGMARVNSYITKGKGTYYGADSDLSGKGKKKEKKEGYVSMAQQRAVWANRKDGGKGHPDNKKKKKSKTEDVNEISKGTLDSYIKKADADKSKKHVRADVGKISRDDAHKNQVKRNKGITLAKAKMKPARVAASEAMSDAEKKAHDAAIAAFKAKGGKVKKLKPGYAQGYHGKADPAAGMKGMMDKGDTKFMPRKKVGSMK